MNTTENTTTHTKEIDGRAVVERWMRSDGYAVSVRTYHHKDRKAYTVTLGSSVIEQYDGFAMERIDMFGDPVRAVLATARVDRFSAAKMEKLHSSTVTPELVARIANLLQSAAPVVAE